MRLRCVERSILVEDDMLAIEALDVLAERVDMQDEKIGQKNHEHHQLWRWSDDRSRIGAQG